MILFQTFLSGPGWPITTYNCPVSLTPINTFILWQVWFSFRGVQMVLGDGFHVTLLKKYTPIT